MHHIIFISIYLLATVDVMILDTVDNTWVVDTVEDTADTVSDAVVDVMMVDDILEGVVSITV